MAGYIKGVDISHQNDGFNFDHLDPEVKFIYLKATQGAKFQDPAFQANWKAARDKGLLHGAYHFLTATDSVNDQVDNFLSRGVDWSLPNVLPPMLDVEDQVPAALNANITKNKPAFIKLVTDWINIVEAETKRKVVIYSYKNFFNDYLNSQSWPNNPLWLASYQPTPPGLPHGWNDWTFWQYSQYGTMAGGVKGGSLDLDYFNGTIEQLAAL